MKKDRKETRYVKSRSDRDGIRVGNFIYDCFRVTKEQLVDKESRVIRDLAVSTDPEVLPGQTEREAIKAIKVLQ